MKFKLLPQIIVMAKYTFIGVYLQCLFAGLLLATDIAAQKKSIEDVYISLDFRNTNLEQAFLEIGTKTDFNFQYDRKLAKNKNLKGNFSEVSLAELLRFISKETSLSFKRINETIHVSKSLIEQASVVELINSNNSIQEIEVTGKVTGDDGEELPGVNVLVEGTINGTITDINGNFKLSAPEDGILVFSFVGYTSQQASIQNRSEVNVQLIPDVTQLSEIVVIGYGTQKKVNLTGSVTQISTENFADAPLTNAALALQGKGSGVQVIQGSGEAGYDQPSIKIRGVGTLGSGRSGPLVLIDGIVGNINNVDPMDIKEVSVLKDAASAAIYGNRAANGVILVTTKSGSRDGSLKVSYNTYYGVQNLTRMPELLSAHEHAVMYNEALTNDGQGTFFSDEDISNLANAERITDLNFGNNFTADQVSNINNYQDVRASDMYYGSSVIQKHHISLQGGGANSKSVFSLGYLDQNGVKVGNWAKNYNARFNQEMFALDDRLRLYAQFYWIKKESDRGADDGIGAWEQIPWSGYRFSNGYYSGSSFRELQLGAINNKESDFVQGIVGADAEIVKNLNLKFEYAIQQTRQKSKKFTPSYKSYEFWQDRIDNNPSSISQEEYSSQRQTTNITLNYDLDIDKHNFTFLAGNANELYEESSFSAGRSNLINNFQPELALGDVGTMVNNSAAGAFGLVSFFGRVHYGFDDRYLFEASIRHDGSSRFADGNQWGTFPSVSAAWRISQESFMDNASWIQNLKLRGSVGTLGNQNVGNNYYAASDILSFGANYPIGNNLEPGGFLQQIADKTVTWETTVQKNIGVDATLLEMFNLSFDYYQRTTEDILLEVNLPLTAGVQDNPVSNLGTVTNKGWDITTGFFKDVSEDFSLSVDLNLSSYKNEVTDLGETETYFFGKDSRTDGNQYVWQEGSASNSFYGFLVGGIVNSDNIGTIPSQVVTVEEGDLWFKDLDGDNEVSYDNDRVIFGTPHPDLIYAMNLSAKWKNFDLSLLLEGVNGIDALTYDVLYMTNFRNIHNKLAYLSDRWTPENTDTNIPKPTTDSEKLPVSDYFMEDASYLRGKDITLGYNLPKDLLSKIRVEKLRVYFNMHNFFTATNYRGLDPERPDPELNVSPQVHPPLRSMTFGLQLQF